jgi:hypothetical protein
MRANRLRDRGVVPYRHEADALIQNPGDFVLVVRGVTRSFVMACPDGCGENLTINLDGRVAKAWRFYRKHNQASLYPSVWRDTGCGSHFIVWNHNIQWCDRHEIRGRANAEDVATLVTKITQVVGGDWIGYVEIAEMIEENPWDVSWVCDALTERGDQLVRGVGKLKGHYRSVLK